ncbi:DUF429 domain-containing protein [Actinokineospora auranticolor]|uniref:Putative RNase H-like nuclease n=1 Tax=Actinokineospora auranticolor TaxID=155976 RepID=A0A2S6GUV4_9PSEU|nr:DUF429 domain-containing protein [Actinokineospora auranticolor]PPK69022.1 putative RNase H-like nuclease [Actinokineospora auranticolor]
MTEVQTARSVAGVDGMPGGWVVATVRPDRSVQWASARTAAEVVDLTAECAAVGVDIPMGLSDKGLRACDIEARLRLGNARASVFYAPVRAVLSATTYSQACDISAAWTTMGHRISKQTWAILPRIRDWDALRADDRVVEVHPEVSFRALAPEVEFASKRTAIGLGQRVAALRGFVDAAGAMTGAPAPAGPDDAMDALVAAWSATRWSDRTAEVLGGEPDPSTGQPMRMVV